ncbi:hypothetical protein ABVT39_021919 [Epinephelus coioides]
MNVCQTLICFFFLSLWDTDLINAQIPIRTGAEGGNITVVCPFTFSGRRRLFCKEKCKDGDSLINTDEVTAQRGRYSIKYKEGFYPASNTILNVSITDLTESDSGRYSCGLLRSVFFIPTYSEFEIRVKDAPTSSDPNWILPPVTAFVPSTSTLTTSQSLSSTSSSASTLTTSQSLSSTSSSASSEGTKQPQQQHTTPAAGSAAKGPLLFVGLTLLIMLIILSAALMMFCRKRASKLKAAPVETEYADVTETNRVCEEIREEDRQSRSPPVEMSTVYSYVKPNGVETLAEYSLVTAATPQRNTEDDSSKLTYSEVDFSEGVSLHSAPCGDADNIVYSVPLVDVSSDTALWDTDLINAQIPIRTGAEGGNITVVCPFTFSGRRRLFCKEKCKDGDSLINTDEVTAQRGRYSIKYKEGFYPASNTILNVSITDLTESDSGRYSCGLLRSVFFIPTYSEFEIRVKDAPTSSDPNWILPPVTAFVPSTSTLTTSQSLSSTSSSASTLTTSQSLSSTSSSASSEGTKQPQQQHTTPAAGSDPLLFVGLTLLIMLIILSAALMMFCRKRASKPKAAPVETEYADVTETNRVCEEIREEDRKSRSPPVEMSTVYSYVKPNGVETSDEYSLVTAATPQRNTEDDSSKLTYSEVDFSEAALWDTDLINAQNSIRTGTKGGNITVVCSFTFSGTTKFFCKNDCEDGDILIQTKEEAAQRDRYSIEYKRGAFYESPLLYVSIRNLTKSDSGRYRCRLTRILSSDVQFEIRVKDAPTSSDPNWTLPPAPAFVPSTSTLTTSQSLSSTSSSASTLMTSQSLSSTSSSASSEGTKQPQQQHTTPAAGSAAKGPLLFVGLTLLIMLIILSAALMMFCRKRASKPKAAPVETEYADVTETNRVCAEIREEDRKSRSPPVEMSTVYSYVKPNGVETLAEYSLVTAATPQRNTEDDSSKLIYSEVDFSEAALWDTDLINARDHIVTGAEGGNIIVVCPFTSSGTTKFFCKDDCEDGDILIQTKEEAAQRGRYSIEYNKVAFYESALLYVSIRNLTKSDSGRYRCRLDRILSSDVQFEIRVKDAPTSSDPNWILPPVTAFVPSTSTLTTSQSLSSTSSSASTLTTSQSLSSTSSSASSEGTKQPQQQHTTPAAGVVLYVRLTLVVMFIVLSTAVVIFYRKRARELKEASVEPEYVNVTETEDDSSKLTYSEVDFSEDASLHSAPCGDAYEFTL